MNKRMMLLALAAVSAAVFALPAVASATSNHINQAPIAFTVHGGAGNLSTTSGSTINCGTTTGTGNFTTTTSGTLNLTFGPHCTTTVFGVSVTCTSTSPEEPSGSISTTPLTFHLIKLDTGGNGILVTPPAGGAFAHFNCAGVQQTVEGNGVIGTITAPGCGVLSKTATIDFNRKSGITHGHQEHTVWTGKTYDLTKEGSTAAMDTHATITYAGGASRSLVCT